MNRKVANSVGTGFLTGYVIIAVVFSIVNVDMPMQAHVLGIIGAILMCRG